MIQVDLRFLAGRYHATPWGHHVNEGEPEWPPSPWRLLRALVWSWKNTAPEVGEEEVQRLLTALAAPPAYCLPRASTSHLRHFMPQKEERLLVHDAFVYVHEARYSPLSCVWEGSLEEGQQELLTRLLLGLTYFGRAESWCEATLAAPSSSPNAAPVASGLRVLDPEATTLLCAEPEVTLEQLMTCTDDLRKAGYNRPPGSQWVTYHRPRGALSGAVLHHVDFPVVRAQPHIAVYAIEGDNLPPITDTLLVAERVRRGLNGAYGQLYDQRTSPNFTGKRDGQVRQDEHQHCYFLPQSSQPNGPLDRLTIWAPAGFAEDELNALKTLRLFPDHRASARRLYLSPIALLGLDARADHFGRSSVWVSSTPYVCPRFPKPRGKNTPEGQIREECQRRGLPDLASIEPHSNPNGQPWTTFAYQRLGKPRPPSAPAGYRLQFSAPVVGPLSLGASCHFGIGQLSSA